jgi:methionine synthase I (cobalamin-dependent)
MTMAAASIYDLIKSRTVLFDGAMGTELMKRGLPQGVSSEEWNISPPRA